VTQIRIIHAFWLPDADGSGRLTAAAEGYSAISLSRRFGSDSARPATLRLSTTDMSAALCPTLAVLTTEHRAKPSARRPARASAVSRTFRRSRDAVISRAKDATDEALTEVANMDSLIDLMVAADEDALVKLVAENVLSFDQKMWIRIAARSDAADSQESKDKLMALAGRCMKLIETMVETTESTIQESSVALETIVATAADPETGEFDVPLKAESIARLRKAVDDAVVDERMLNTVYAWIRKSDEDKLDGMVHILQHLLQCYAARELDNGETPLDVVIGAAASEWPAKFEEIIEGGFGEEAFTRDLQKRMEGVVLNLPNGSYAQRVQAEYLKEVEDRGKELYSAKAA